MAMSDPRTKQAVLDADFLALRAKILEVAAGLDRFDHAPGEPGADPRRDRLTTPSSSCSPTTPTAPSSVQLLFSRTYDTKWREELGV